MISVIVPTMWRYEPFLDFLEDILKVPEVGEVIIINNAVDATPNSKVLEHNKIKMYNMEKNIYVNPAWNLGATVSQYNKLCFLNDDAVVDLKLFSVMDVWLTDHVGACGIVELQPGLNQPPFINGSIDLVMRTDQNCYGFGVLFFIHKNNWIEIPSELINACGDNWVFESQIFLKKKPNYLIANTFFYHAVSKTNNSLPNEERAALYKKESAAYEEIAKLLRGIA